MVFANYYFDFAFPPFFDEPALGPFTNFLLGLFFTFIGLLFAFNLLEGVEGFPS